MTQIQTKPYVIGITGTIASGKSLVGEFLQEAGVPVLDTDQVVGDLYQHDAALIDRLVATFGPQIRDSRGQIDKGALRRIVFDNPPQLRQLEGLVHPRVREAVQAFIRENAPVCPIQAVLVPLLFEAQTEDQYDEIWAVVVEPEERLIERLMQRDQISREEAQKRLLAQWPQAQKAGRAHRIIHNSGLQEDTRSQVLSALETIRKGIPV